MDFFIWNIKILIFFNFSGLIHETRDLVFWPGQFQTGFNNYGIERGRGGFWFFITEDAREIHVKIWQSDGLYFSNVAKMMTWLLTNILTRELNLHYMVNLRGHFLLLGTPRLISTFILARFLVLSSCSSFRKVQASLTVTINSPLIYYFY